MRFGNISVFKPLLELAIAASIINELDKKNAMNKTEFTPLNRQERKTELECYKEQVKELENRNRKLNDKIDELETIIERHLSGWVVVVLGIILIGLIGIINIFSN